MTVSHNYGRTSFVSKNSKMATLAGLLLSIVAMSARADSIAIEGAWMRAVPPVSTNSAAYMMIMNASAKSDRILSASSPLAGAVEVHQMIHQDGLMKMLHVGSVEIPAGGHLQMAPTGYHFMMMNLKRVPKEGETVPMTIRFKQAGALTIQLPVKRSAGMSH